jgi:hypothetical protein
MEYTIRSEKLAIAVAGWVEKGLVELLVGKPPKSLSGTGIVDSETITADDVGVITAANLI